MLVVDHAARAREHIALRSMFAARKRVFVDLLKWDLPVLAGSFEVDRRDGPGATYLIVTGADGAHRASARLLPEPAAALERLRGPRPASAAGARARCVAEVSHVCLSPDIGTIDRRRARDQLLHGLVDHALARQIDGFVGMAERRWLRPIENLGWTCRRLGAVRGDCGRDLVGVAVDIDGATPARLAAAGVTRPAAFGAPPP